MQLRCSAGQRYAPRRRRHTGSLVHLHYATHHVLDRLPENIAMRFLRDLLRQCNATRYHQRFSDWSSGLVIRTKTKIIEGRRIRFFRGNRRQLWFSCLRSYTTTTRNTIANAVSEWRCTLTTAKWTTDGCDMVTPVRCTEPARARVRCHSVG
jgi:hypothetical protein